MNLTITLSEALSQRLLAHAEQIEMTASQLAEAWLANMLREAEQRKQAQLELEGVVKRAKALPPLQPSQVHPATASLRDLLAKSILENDNNNEA